MPIISNTAPIDMSVIARVLDCPHNSYTSAMSGFTNIDKIAPSDNPEITQYEEYLSRFRHRVNALEHTIMPITKPIISIKSNAIICGYAEI